MGCTSSQEVVSSGSIGSIAEKNLRKEVSKKVKNATGKCVFSFINIFKYIFNYFDFSSLIQVYSFLDFFVINI